MGTVGGVSKGNPGLAGVAAEAIVRKAQYRHVQIFLIVSSGWVCGT
jgi:hypothetical protein